MNTKPEETAFMTQLFTNLWAGKGMGKVKKSEGEGIRKSDPTLNVD